MRIRRIARGSFLTHSGFCLWRNSDTPRGPKRENDFRVSWQHPPKPSPFRKIPYEIVEGICAVVLVAGNGCVAVCAVAGGITRASALSFRLRDRSLARAVGRHATR